MPPARVSIIAMPGEPPSVHVNGMPLPAVKSAQVTATVDGVPQVALVLAASQVDWDGDATITVLRAGPGATDFADQLDVQQLEHDALTRIDDCTQGEAFAAAVRVQAAAFDDRG